MMAIRDQVEDAQEFERWSATYEHSWMQPVGFDRVHQVVLNLIASENEGTAPESILDVGCGTGRLLRKAGVRWPAAQLIGVDPAEGMVNVARRLMPTATFKIGSAAALPLADASVDLAMSTVSFHHWHNQGAAVREVARVLRPGGRFVLADFVLPPGMSRLIDHFGSNSPAAVRHLFEQAGLHIRSQRRRFPFCLLLTVGQQPQSDSIGSTA
jgi:ubiquinone/menaquinone biosynthesis C-methylase UbiE